MKILSMLFVLATLGTLAGCLVRTGPAYGPAYETRRSDGRACPPAYHWDGGACVHNGNGRHRGN